jgi:ATP-dependent helicase HepA
VTNWLIDNGAEDQSAAYGRILAILTSRADGVSQDLADALRWRLSGDTAAATRAGLTKEERSILRSPQVISAEAGILDPLTDQSGTGEQVGALVEVLIPVFRKHRRIVVFCGPGTLAAKLAACLRQRIPAGRIAEHTARQDAAASETAVGHWREHGGILVADDSAEDGLNLQDADAVVHTRLPWSPNRLEQRIGRVDRYGEGSARQYVVTSPDGQDAFPGAWLSLLMGAFGIFSQSVSALQDSIDQGLTAIWAVGMADGPAGLVSLDARIREDLASERREIDEMDMVDSIHESSSGTRDIPAAIGTLEMGWREIESAVVGYAGDGSAGLRFGSQRNVTLQETWPR